MDIKSEHALGEKAVRILYPLFVGQGFSIVFTAITFIVVARLLGPVSYGLYVFAFGFSTFVNGFAAFGIGAYFSNILAKLAYERDGEGILRALTSGYIIAGAVGIILTLLGIALSGYVASIFPNVGITPELLELTSATIVFIIIDTIAVSALIGFARAGLASVSNVSVDLIQLVLSVVLTISIGVVGSVEAMLIGYILGAVIGTYFVYVAASRYTKFRIAIPTLKHLKNVFSFVTPIAATNFLNTGMQNFSILFLGLFVSTAVLGNYGAASRGLALLSMIYSTLGSGLFPIFTTAREIDRNSTVNSTYNKIIHFSLLLMLPIVVYVGVMAMPGLDVLVSSSYFTAPYYLALIAIGTTLGLFGGYINNLLISEGYTRSVLRINAVSAVFQLVFMIALVPSLYVVGAILAIFYLGNIVEAIMFTSEAKKLFGIKFEYRNLFLLYMSNLAVGILLAGLLGVMNNMIVMSPLYAKYIMEMAVGFVFLLLVYPIILLEFRAMSKHDIKSMRHATMRMGKASAVFATFFDYSEFVSNILMRG